MTKGGRNALYSLRDGTSIIFKEVLIKDWMLSFGIGRTTWRKQKNNLMIRKFIKNLEMLKAHWTNYKKGDKKTKK